jgi:Ca2+-binding RTX toxin-like protein
MTHTNQTVDSIGSGFRFQFAAAGDSYLVASGVTVRSTDNSTVYGTYVGNSVQVDGLVESVNLIAVVLAGAGSELNIGQHGTVSTVNTTSGNAVVFMSGGTSTIGNSGRIVGETTIGILTAGNANDVVNEGLVKGASGVFINLAGGSGDSFENFGRVSANSFDDDIQGYRFNNGVFSEGADTLVVNHKQGNISAISSEGAGVAIADSGDGSRVVNEGKITSGLWYGIDFFLMGATDSARLENSGRISGHAGSFRGNEAADFVTNTGVMKGDVVFNAGDDVLDGGKGKIIGNVNGGDGNDILRTGGGNQEIDGGANNDIIDGGKGVDELRGGAGLDRFVFSTGYGKDEIMDFSSESDLIDISDWKAISDFQDMLSHAQNKSGDVWIIAGRDTLIIDNAVKNDLAAADFII